MNELKITLSEVSETANQIRTQNANLDEILSYVSRVMNDLNSVWESDGAETLLERFMNFSSRFLDESQTIESYANYLDQTVSMYDSLETTITSNASNFE